MGASRAFRILAASVLLTLPSFAAGTAAKAPAKAAAPAPAAPAAPTVPPEREPAVALAHRVEHLKAALLSGRNDAIEAAVQEVETLRRHYGTTEVLPLVEAMALWSQDQGRLGHTEAGLRALTEMERWAPQNPVLLSARVNLLREQGLGGWAQGVPDLLRLTRLRLSRPEWRGLWLVQHLDPLRVFASLLLWGWALALVLRYRNVIRSQWEERLEAMGLSPVVGALLGALLMALPAFAGLDPGVVAMFWLWLAAPFLLSTEVKATVLILALQLVHPALALLEPMAAPEVKPSIVALQLQPQIRPAGPDRLGKLPASDQAFLKGWQALQNRDWKEAQALFGALVSKHPDQVQVLNDLGVAKFQGGDAAGAEKDFEAAERLDPRALEVLLNESILAFGRLDTAAGAAKQEAARAVDPDRFSALMALNGSLRSQQRTFAMPLPDTEERTRALGASDRGDLLSRAPLRDPGFLVPLLLPILAGLFFVARVRGAMKAAHPSQCVRCGEPFHTTDSPDPEICGACHHLFILKDGQHVESRRKKVEQVSGFQGAMRTIHRTLIVALPGLDLVFMGDTGEGLLEFGLVCFALGLALATGHRLRYPGEVLPDPASTWILLGGVLAFLFYLRSWMKLLPRKG